MNPPGLSPTVLDAPWLPVRSFHDRIYRGEVFCLRGGAPAAEVIAVARRACETALAPRHPTRAHEEASPARLALLQREFARSPDARAAWRALFAGLGLPVEQVARDRLRLRFQTHHPAGSERSPRAITAPLPVHRDTWGSNLYAQVNWWMPVWPLAAGRTMALYPGWWGRPAGNTSAHFDLPAVVERNRAARPGGAVAGDLIPRLRTPLPEGDARPVLIEPGSVLAFSGAHLHGSVPNTTGITRVSLETRTLFLPDLLARRGAGNVDGASPWTAPGWFRRLDDGAPLATLLGVPPICRVEALEARLDALDGADPSPLFTTMRCA